MSDIIIIDYAALREAEQNKIALQEQLIETRTHSAHLTERYIKMFGRCMSESRMTQMQQHLNEQICSIREMEQELAQMQATPHPATTI